MCTVPPSSATRSRMCASPEPACAAAGSKPVPVSRTASSTCPSWRVIDTAAPHAGSGLAHIRDRVAELGGTVDIDSAPGRGAALTVRVPVP